MSRDDLLATNAKIMKAVCEGIKENAPESVVIICLKPTGCHDLCCTPDIRISD